MSIPSDRATDQLILQVGADFTGLGLSIRIEADGGLVVVVASVSSNFCPNPVEAFGAVATLDDAGLYEAERIATFRALERFEAANNNERSTNRPVHQPQNRPPAPPTTQQAALPRNPVQPPPQAPQQPQQGASNDGPTDKQVKFANDLVRDRSKGRGSIDDLTHSLFGVPFVGLSRSEASALIERLKTGGHPDFFARFDDGPPPF